MQAVANVIAAVIERNYQEERLRERQLGRAEQMAAIGQVAAGVAHELRNPLTSVKGLVQVNLRDAGARGLPAEDLAVIEQEVRRMERTLQTFLDFARPPRPDRRRLDLAEVVERVYTLVAGRAKKQAVALRFLRPDDPAWVDGDRDQLQQLTQQVGGVEVDLAGVRRQIDGVDGVIAGVEEEIGILSGEAGGLQQKIAGQRQQVTSLDEKIELAQAEADNLEEEVRRGEEAWTVARVQAQEADEAAAAVRATLEELQRAAETGAGITIPNFWDPKRRVERPAAGAVQAIRFVTTDDFPPFIFTRTV